MTTIEPRPIFEIAQEIRREWKNVSPHADPYLRAMDQLTLVTDKYGADDADSIIRDFLSNAIPWRGDAARRIKAELKAMIA